MLSRYLNPDLTIDLDAVEADAVRAADHAMARLTPGSKTTWDKAHDAAHARYLDLAQGYRATEIFHRDRAVTDAERAALPARDRRILALREIAHLAPMIDSTLAAIAEQDAAERELAALTAGAR